MKVNFGFWKKNTYLHPGNLIGLAASAITQIVVLHLLIENQATTRTGLIVRGITLIVLPLVASIFTSRMARDSTQKLQSKLFKNLSLTPTNKLEQLHAHRFAKAATLDVDHLYQFWREFFTNAGFNLPVLLYLIALLLAENELLVVISSVACMAALLPIAYKINYELRRQQRIHHNSYLSLQDKIRNYVDNVLQFRLYQNEKTYLSSLGNDLSFFGRLTIKLMQSRQLYATCISVLLLIFLWAVLWLIQNTRAISPSEIAVITLILLEIRRIGSEIFSNINSFQRASESATTLSPWLADEIPKEDSYPKTVPFESLQVQNLEFRYNTADKSISYPDFEINKGDKIWIKGRNGKGKSTLWKILTGLYTAPKNTIWVNNSSENGDGLTPFWTQLSAVTEPGRCFSGKIWEIIGNFSTDQTSVKTWLSDQKLLDSFDTYPSQLDTHYDSAVGNLSAGQLKWLLIVQAFFQQPELLILDEPFASLDAQRKKLTLGLIASLPPSVTCVVITHHDAVPNFDKIITL